MDVQPSEEGPRDRDIVPEKRRLRARPNNDLGNGKVRPREGSPSLLCIGRYARIKVHRRGVMELGFGSSEGKF